MELKEMVMMTLSELEEEPSTETQDDQEVIDTEEMTSPIATATEESDDVKIETSEQQFYENIREKLLVIFEGFQAPNNKNIEAKIDLTLNFLEYLLARIDERLEHIKTPKS
ncbi:CiaD-like domain-containing protein [Sulfurospirillum sp. 1612]|uniref:CiaD-like domain-containing protein n=1 Tax=Sulfurospirillum sp. 1612 TaxID=3094835 RepID=UPI002F933C81